MDLFCEVFSDTRVFERPREEEKTSKIRCHPGKSRLLKQLLSLLVHASESLGLEFSSNALGSHFERKENRNLRNASVKTSRDSRDKR